MKPKAQLSYLALWLVQLLRDNQMLRHDYLIMLDQLSSIQATCSTQVETIRALKHQIATLQDEQT